MAARHISRFKTKRLFFVAAILSGIILLIVYLLRSNSLQTMDEDKLVIQKFTKHNLVKIPKNINDLMILTQPNDHLHRQKLYESMVHTEIKAKLSKYSEPSIKIHIPKLVHIDLKGAPFKTDFYKELFPFLKDLGVNGILLEYEDMFPYMEKIHANNAYSIKEIQVINNLAFQNDLKIIPLLQTLGHMEFILKLDNYKNLREVPKYMQSICPNREGTFNLITNMIDQVVFNHPNITHIHIGSDEVEHIGLCEKCKIIMEKNNWKPFNIYLDHVTKLAKYVKEKHHIQVIIWDDMLRLINEDVLVESKLGKYVEIMVWNYNPTFDFSESLWKTYEQIFPKIWIASSFKGATGPAKYYTNITFHLENHKFWLHFLKNNYKPDKFQGLVLTGWQRYNHFSVLCELFPSAIPSLVTNLVYLENDALKQDIIVQKLGCPEEWTIFDYDMQPILCEFPGSKIYKGILRLHLLDKKAKRFFKSNYFTGWLNPYNIKHNFSSPLIIDQALEKINQIKISYIMLNTFMNNIMPQIYDEFTIKEWLETNVWPTLNKLAQIEKFSQKLALNNQFPRRPIA